MNQLNRLQEHHDNQFPSEDDNLCLRCHEKEAPGSDYCEYCSNILLPVTRFNFEDE